MTTRLATVLDQIESALSRGDAREMTAAFAQAARMMPHENAGGLRAHYRAICGLSDAARERGLVLAALPLMQALEDAVAASGQFSRLDTDDLLMGRAIFESEAGQFAVAVRSLDRLLLRSGIAPFVEAIATLALGTSLAAIGDRRAIATLRKGLGFIVRVAPPGAPEIARAKLDLARAAMEMEGRVAEAETLAREALPLVDPMPGILPAFARDVLGRALQVQGKYDAARRCFEEALALVQQRVDPAHPVLFAALANLGTMYFAQGDYLAAERLLEEAYAHVVKVLGDDASAAVPLLLGLANVRIETGDQAGAERLLSRAQKTLQARPDDSPPQALGYVLGRLGSIALRHEDLAAARSHFEEAARLLAGTAFETIPLGALARIRIRSGDPLGAERDIRGRIEQLRAAGLLQSGEGAFAWLDLALARLAQRQWSDVIVHVDTAIAILETVLGATYPDIALCLQTRVCAQIGLRDFDGVAASLDRIRRIEQRQLVDSLAVMAASRRAALLERMRNSLALTISAHLDFAPFNAACQTAARALLSARKGLSGEAERQRFEALRSRLAADEQQLLDRYSGILQQLSGHLVDPDPQLNETARSNLTLALNEEKEAIERAMPPAVLPQHLGTELTSGAIATCLAPGEVFIDYVFYQSIDPVRQQPIAGDATGYGAYWVASDGTCGATRIGSGAAVKDLVERFHRAIHEENGEELSCVSVDGYRLLLASLPKHIAQASRLQISPDGMLYLLPFAALMREPGMTLVQTTTITYVDSARDLLATRPLSTPRERAAVIGDPDYYANVGNLRSEQLEDVPGGEAELMALREVLPGARFWTRADATKERLMNLHGPILLHVVTHGALYEGDEVQDLAMAQSAIALAGYNDADRGIRDGALTGLEASLLDLAGCELVTLSACDTGRGRIDAGQGVLGLRRGLQIAGTRSQVVTLWSVVGETTARFMTHFYRALADSLPREEAMRNAQLAIAKEFDGRPLFWAPFVLFGARGPIDARSL